MQFLVQKTLSNQFRNSIICLGTKSCNYFLTYLLTYLFTYSKEQSPWEANRFLASQEITRILRNWKVHFHIHTCPLFLADSIQSTPPYPTSWRTIFILSSNLRLVLPNGFFPSGFHTKTLYTPLLAPYVLHTLPISFFLIWSHEKYRARKRDHWANDYVVFSIPLLPLPS